MTEKLSREEIETRLQGLPKYLVVGFAARIATYVLPALTEDYDKKGFLWFWKKEEREKHLLALFQALKTAWYISATKDKENKVFIDYSYPIHISNTITSATYVINSIHTAVLAAITHSNDYAHAYASATNANANCITGYDITVTMSEFNLLTSPESYLFQPLLKHPQQDIFIQLLKNTDFDYWMDWYQNRINGNFFNSQDFDSDLELLKRIILLPEEVVSKSRSGVIKYLANLMGNHAKQPLNKVRVIFIGHGAAGKTSLVRALHGESVVEGREGMTCGIDIRQWHRSYALTA